MAGESHALTVRIAPSADADLEHIWTWNARRYDANHADAYYKFLVDETKKLATDYIYGHPVPGHPGYLSTTIRKGSGHGYVALYRLRVEVVEVVHYYHTSQDWLSRLNAENY